MSGLGGLAMRATRRVSREQKPWGGIVPKVGSFPQIPERRTKAADHAVNAPDFAAIIPDNYRKPCGD
jgi:hypothetical protein